MSSRLVAEMGEAETKYSLTASAVELLLGGPIGGLPLSLGEGAVVSAPSTGEEVGTMPGVVGDGALTIGGRVGGRTLF